MPSADVWAWSTADTASLLASIAGDLVGFLGLVAAFLIGLGLVAKIAR